MGVSCAHYTQFPPATREQHMGLNIRDNMSKVPLLERRLEPIQVGDEKEKLIT